MGLLSRLASPFSPLRGQRLLRRLLAEQRLQRRALERLADAVELALSQPAAAKGQAFRSFARTKGELSEPELREVSAVSYVNTQELARMLDEEERLRGVLGRDPTEEELRARLEGERV